MPRLPLAALLILAFAAGPALAVVRTAGDVKPAAPGGLLPIGIPGIDDDGDEIADWIDSGGNSARLGLADPTVPGGTGNFPGALPWLDARVWVNYDTTQNILVGETGYGLLEIDGASALRYQHLVLGGASAESVGAAGRLRLTTTGSSENYDFLLDLLQPNLPRTGYGAMTVSGFNSVFNNDPNIIPADLQAVINFATGAAPGTPVFDLDDVTMISNGIPVTTRPVSNNPFASFDVHVGLLGSGELNVLAGGRVEIQDALQVATSSTSIGNVTVDGFGSYLVASGRNNFTGIITQTATQFASYLGGNGNGTMTVSNRGRADFANGLSIGATNSANPLLEFAPDADIAASGTLLVTGAGSTVTVAPTAVVGGTGDGLGNGADLAVGELRDLTGSSGMDNLRFDDDGDRITAPDGTEYLGEGLMRIEDGGRVNVTAAGNLGVGYHGRIEMRSGTLNVGGNIINDGRIDGDGTILAQTLDTTVYSNLIGGDPDALPGNPATAPLRLNLVGATNLGGGPTFTNRGSVSGLVEIDATGDLENRGVIDVSGEINAGSLVTTVDSRLGGNASFGTPLRIRLASIGQVDNADPAFRNLGALTGEIDLVTAGGIVNGDDPFTQGSTAGNGGVIDATGTIRSGTFVNYGRGSVVVGPGESLSILATGTDPNLNNSLGLSQSFARVPTIREDGIDPTTADGVIDSRGTAGFFQANLGDIRVTGGTLELGRLTDSEPQAPFDTLHVNLFRNARDYEPASGGGPERETIGTITSSDGEVRFRDGVYNTGVIAFTGGDNLVAGTVLNAGSEVVDPGPDMVVGTPDDGGVLGRGIEYGNGATSVIRPGVIVVSGDGTSVTFEDKVTNGGVISIGPGNNVVNFLGDFENNGVIDIAISGVTGDPESAYLTVAGGVSINGGLFALTPIGPAFAFSEGFSVDILSAESVAAGSLFTSLDLPALDDGLFWELVYDEANAEVRAEVIASLAVGADFNGDELVTQADIDIWIRNVGIQSGALANMGDVDLDGDVDLADYDLLMVQFRDGTPTLVGSAAGGALVPEPTALALLLLATAGAVGRRR